VSSILKPLDFKESKQLLGLGKNQSQDFDAQIASNTISFIQYIILATHKRANNYETIGGIFKGTKDDIAEQIFTDRLFVLIMELIEMLVNILNILDLAIDMDMACRKSLSLCLLETSYFFGSYR